MTQRSDEGSDLPPKRALVDAYRDVLTDQARRRKEATRARLPEPKKRSPVVATGLVIVAAVAAGLVLQPGWFGLARDQETVVESNANLRVMMFVAARRVHEYKKANGAYPASLSTVGAAGEGLLYRPTPAGGFELTGERGGQTLRLTETDSLAAFLGPGMSGLLQEKH